MVEDAVIDPDNLHDESLKIPQLHSKYYTLYNTITLLRERARERYNKVKLERHNFYTGKADPAVYEEEPFPYKVREKDAIQRYLDADDRLNKVDMKIRYYDATLKFLEEIIKTVANRFSKSRMLLRAEVPSRFLMDDNNEWKYQDDFDESLLYVELQFGVEDLRLLYKSVAVHYENGQRRY